jgi:hypothetical protein
MSCTNCGAKWIDRLPDGDDPRGGAYADGFKAGVAHARKEMRP